MGVDGIDIDVLNANIARVLSHGWFCSFVQMFGENFCTNLVDASVILLEVCWQADASRCPSCTRMLVFKINFYVNDAIELMIKTCMKFISGVDRYNGQCLSKITARLHKMSAPPKIRLFPLEICAVYDQALQCFLLCETFCTFVPYDNLTRLEYFSHSRVLLMLHVGALSVFCKFNGSFNAEFVRPPSKESCAIPDNAIASAILFCDLMVAKISERRKVLPVPPGHL
ncbi:transposon Tf2-6 polyprotein [Trichonephila clavipes]|nr:transposon Tf2-6 polyprotein [Trichonephila clavipes]